MDSSDPFADPEADAAPGSGASSDAAPGSGASSDAASAAGAPSGGAADRPPRRVLLAEDEALIRLDLKEMLEEEGYAVVGEAGDGATAVAMAEQLRPDLVILDVKMPGLDGLAAAEQIGQARLAPVVMLTAFSQRELVERARDAGAMAYLVKPFQKKDLLPAIEMAASRHAEIVGLEAEVGDLEARLAARKLLDRAKALLQAEHGMSEAEAFRFVQRTSMNRRTTMAAVADAVLTGGLRPTS